LGRRLANSALHPTSRRRHGVCAGLNSSWRVLAGERPCHWIVSRSEKVTNSLTVASDSHYVLWPSYARIVANPHHQWQSKTCDYKHNLAAVARLCFKFRMAKLCLQVVRRQGYASNCPSLGEDGSSCGSRHPSSTSIVRQAARASGARMRPGFGSTPATRLRFGYRPLS
jgi:hypothetical protein